MPTAPRELPAPLCIGCDPSFYEWAAHLSTSKSPSAAQSLAAVFLAKAALVAGLPLVASLSPTMSCPMRSPLLLTACLSLLTSSLALALLLAGCSLCALPTAFHLKDPNLCPG